jgi:predicted DNA binding protein
MATHAKPTRRTRNRTDQEGASHKDETVIIKEESRTGRDSPSAIDTAGSDHLVVCKTHFSLPPASWHSIITRKYPETPVEVLSYSQIDDWTLMDVRVHTNDIAPWIDELRSLKDIHEVKPFVRADGATTLRVVYKEVGVISAVQRLHLLLRTPFTISDGVTVVTAAGPEANIQRFITMFPQHVQIDAVYNTERSHDDLLTNRQSEVLRMAMVAGYFEVPRRITLTKLATKIGVAPASLSEILAVVEKKILQDSRAARTQ